MEAVKTLEAELAKLRTETENRGRHYVQLKSDCLMALIECALAANTKPAPFAGMDLAKSAVDETAVKRGRKPKAE